MTYELQFVYSMSYFSTSITLSEYDHMAIERCVEDERPAFAPVTAPPEIPSALVDVQVDGVPARPKIRKRKPTGDRVTLKRGREKIALRHRLRVRELAGLVAMDGLSFKEAAEKMGLSYGHVVGHLWPAAKELCAADFGDQSEREALAHFVVSTVRRVAKAAVERLEGDQGAAFGAVAVKAAETLGQWAGVESIVRPGGEEQSEVLRTIAEVGDAVLAVSPLLAARLEYIERARARRELMAGGADTTTG